MRLTFEDGTLLLRDYREGEPVPPAFVWDDRVDIWRAQALFYRESLEFLRQNDADLNNTAPRYNKFTLELKSTPERADGRHVLLDTLVGPTAYEKGIVELSGDYLAEYRVESRPVQMVAEERAIYETARSEYRIQPNDVITQLEKVN